MRPSLAPLSVGLLSFFASIASAPRRVTSISSATSGRSSPTSVSSVTGPPSKNANSVSTNESRLSVVTSSCLDAPRAANSSNVSSPWTRIACRRRRPANVSSPRRSKSSRSGSHKVPNTPRTGPSSSQNGAVAGRQGSFLASQRGRSLSSRLAGAGGPEPVARGRPRNLDPPTIAGSHRPVAVAQGSGRIRPRPDAEAYEKLVDRLLASPHYGERTGPALARPGPLRRLQWLHHRRQTIHLAVARLGHRRVQSQHAVRPIHHRTVRRRPAAGGDTAQFIATGFHRNTSFNEEGGTNPEQFRVERVVDRTNTTGAVARAHRRLAQCHDHKYDPISQKEYYQLYAFLNSTRSPS